MSWAFDPAGHSYPIINYARAISAALLQTWPTEFQEDLDLPDTRCPACNSPDNTGQVLSRLCKGNFLFGLEDTYPSCFFDSKELDVDGGIGAYGTVTATGFSFFGESSDHVVVVMDCPTCQFDIGTSFPITVAPAPGTIQLQYVPFPNEPVGGLGISGDLLLTGCEIVMRNNLTNEPIHILIQGVVVGMVEVNDLRDPMNPIIEQKSITTGELNVLAVASGPWLEQLCESGRGTE